MHATDITAKTKSYQLDRQNNFGDASFVQQYKRTEILQKKIL